MQLRTGNTLALGYWIPASFVVLLCPLAAYAEPGGSSSHLPVLWLITAVGTVGAAMVPLLIRKLNKSRGPAWPFWVAAILMALAFLVFIGPLILILGSILMTGRTM